MANITSYLILDKTDLKNDKLYVSADKTIMGLLVALIDPALLVEPKIGSSNEHYKYIKNPPKSITLAIGDKEVAKETLIGALEFAGII